MNFLEEFKAFALRGNALDLAVGVVIGAAFNGIVTSLVNNILTPPLGLAIGGVNFSELVFPLGGTASIQYGIFIQAVISFVITALALFFLVKLINKFLSTPAKGPVEPAPKSPELLVLEDIRDSLRK